MGIVGTDTTLGAATPIILPATPAWPPWCSARHKRLLRWLVRKATPDELPVVLASIASTKPITLAPVEGGQ